MPDWLRKNQALHSSCVAGAVSEEEYLAGLRAAGLEEVSVLDRLVYDESQLQAFIEDELPVDKEALTAAGSGCCGSDACAVSPKDIAKAMAGKVWSAKFTAQKPCC
jgi:hypothetical protein